MRTQDLIAHKQQGRAHTSEEIEAFITRVSQGEVPDYQTAAWLSAVFFKGMTDEETTALTEAMWKSGNSLPHSPSSYSMDKHSTGGVGDKTSMILVPLLMATSRRVLGPGAVRIPMVSGRSLGHTGGTLDKLESVPGFRTSLSWSEAVRQLETAGFFMMGQTAEMAPADRILYALRDATHTVESLPLIVSSILSKKLSEGLNGIVFDVKIGSGAFLTSPGAGEILAHTLVRIASRAGLDATAVLTAMDEPLGRTAGNLLEMQECMQFLEGSARDAGLLKVTLALGSEMLSFASRGSVTAHEANRLLEAELRTDAPLRAFREMLELQGGDFDVFEEQCKAVHVDLKTTVIAAPTSGWLSHTEARAVGKAVQLLGGGRHKKDATIDPLVGIEFLKKVGDAVRTGEGIVRIYHRASDDMNPVVKFLHPAIRVSAVEVKPTRWVLGRVGAGHPNSKGSLSDSVNG